MIDSVARVFSFIVVLVLVAWDNGLTFEKTALTIAAMAAALGLTDTDLDNLFTDAASITV